MADITDLLNAWTAEDSEARDALIPHVYAEIKAIAHNLLRNERSNGTLSATVLAHEAHVRLVDRNRVRFDPGPAPTR
jgi:RNA polymerase sigma-70 factor, ECF subfamily